MIQILELNYWILRICKSWGYIVKDVVITLVYSCRTVSGEEYVDQSQLTVDAVDRVDVSLRFENLGEIAFNAFITFELPRNLFTHRRVLPPSVSVK